MKLNETDLSVHDREWIERELGADEELLLVSKPKTSLWKPGYGFRLFFAMLWNGFLGVMGWVLASHLHEEHAQLPILVLSLGLLPFVAIGIGFIISPWWERELDRRTIYVLTSTRAMVLRPSMLRRRPTCRSYPLTHDLIKDVREYSHDCGDIVMEEVWNHRHCIPLGFLFVPDVRELECAIRHHLPAPPPPTPEQADEADTPRPSFLSLLLPLTFLVCSGNALQNQLELLQKPECYKQALSIVVFLTLVCILCINKLFRACGLYLKPRKR